jgi:hypothetical protein
MHVDIAGSLPPGTLSDDFSFRVIADGGMESVRVRKLRLDSPHAG